MQFFMVFAGYSSKASFDPVMMVHFRKRFSEGLKRINELIVESGMAKVIKCRHQTTTTTATIEVLMQEPRSQSTIS